MIDPLEEELITPADAARYYPRGPSGRRVHVSRVYRDMLHGHDGVVLESIRTPRLATSREAVGRFFTRLTEKTRGDRPMPTAVGVSARNLDAVTRQLDALGL